MFERLTDRARKVMALANQEAQRFNHEYIGTEHILLGLVKEGSGVGANVLK
ncbi:MAG: Clp protease N-terminal domain-containing protein, partial [Phycisphaerales bacterium]